MTTIAELRAKLMNPDTHPINYLMHLAVSGAQLGALLDVAKAAEGIPVSRISQELHEALDRLREVGG